MFRYWLVLVAGQLLWSCIENPHPSQKAGQSIAMSKKTVEWGHQTNIYEVNIRQYTPEGTFEAFAKHLPRLRDMGVETLWFMPITPISQKNKKGTLGSPYACADYTAVNPEFGTLDDFKHLVSTAHQMGFKVIIDWVANHTGWDHAWTRSNPEYYLIDPATNDFQVASGMDDIIELDFRNPSMRQAMIDAMKFWIREAEIDGFRCDLAAWVELDFWQEARPKVDALKKMFWLGEFDELDNPGYGEVFDASYSWIWMHTTRDYYQNHQHLGMLDSLLQRYDSIGNNSMRAWFTTNHDENSWNGTEYDKYGNIAKALAVFSATWNGVPLLYSGQELPNTKRLAFFEKDPIEWRDTMALHDFYKTLLGLQHRHPALQGGNPAIATHRLKTNRDDKIFSYLRSAGDKKVLVILNLSDESPISVSFDDEQLSGTFRNVFSGEKTIFSGTETLQLKAGDYLVFEI
jgi:glycosidase